MIRLRLLAAKLIAMGAICAGVTREVELWYRLGEAGLLIKTITWILWKTRLSWKVLVEIFYLTARRYSRLILNGLFTSGLSDEEKVRKSRMR